MDIISKFKSCFKRNDYFQVPTEKIEITEGDCKKLVEKVDELLEDTKALNAENVKNIAGYYIQIFTYSPSESMQLTYKIRKFSAYQENGKYLKLREVFFNITRQHQKEIKDKLLKECFNGQCACMM